MAKIKTRARALDMLGRQQIAGIPTALSELFKNAHDAYANHVDVDFIRKINALILRDDGLGMTREEFEKRWLTIGTDSKYQHIGSMEMPHTDISKNKREIMGEKGIGRLAIAAIGPQTLILTRSKHIFKKADNITHELGNLVVCFVNWSLFTLPGLDLDDIEIPIIEIQGGSMLNKSQLIELIEQTKKNLNDISIKIPGIDLSIIEKQLKLFSDFDPVILANAPKGPTLTGDGHGTQFVILPVDETLSSDVDNIASTKKDEASRLEKGLLGFTNTMNIEVNPPIIARFRDYTLDGECIERIGENSFFTPEEYKLADHHIKGNFDNFGQFKGSVTIYGEETKEYILPWTEGRNEPTRCGEFSFNLAYIQGLSKESKLPTEIWKDIARKTDRIGGLYIYRDGIRVLPYGDIDFDFLSIEKRRTLKASTAFFSHRRMFGYVEITRKSNSSMQEKAGREGFIDNPAYRDFKSILENFFIQLAADIFNEKGELSDYFNQRKDRLNKENELLVRRASKIKPKRDKLRNELEAFFTKCQSNYWSDEAVNLFSRVKNHLKNAEDSIDKQFSSDIIFDIEEKTNIQILNLIDQTKIIRPSGIGLTKDLSNLWDAYQIEKEKIIKDIIQPTKENISLLLISYDKKFNSEVETRKRLQKSIKIQIEQQNNQVAKHLSAANKALSEVQHWAKKIIKESREEAKKNFNIIQSSLSSNDLRGHSHELIYELKLNLEKKIDLSSGNIIEHMDNLAHQLKTIKENQTNETGNSVSALAALESQYEALKEEHYKNIELAQLGMAIGVIHHEFESHIRTIRRSLKELKPWADKNQRLQGVFLQLRASFDHLDGYLGLFTPLGRRLNRKKVHVTGSAILDFINDVFDEKIKENNVKIKHTDDFVEQSIFTYTSSLYPAFINIIDNAIYWVCQNDREREIILGTTGSGFYIQDSGPGIQIKDRNSIFEYGFTRKKDGRGMGLYVSILSLTQVDIQLSLADYNINNGACFIIEPVKTTVEEGEK
ncbi:TPA: ATP-binding protein [Yersinia enterocolitica]|nr:ATP-binding protein [Yersinia enterocolitica]HEI6786179.1 ATP-binding protein [Yersinia enterocolitica]HEI6862794.1 ATP-binding protein [Yersinia enterocolitica]